MLKINPAIMNLFYPVGTYYETSDDNFDPNVSWGGTWVLDSQGRVTVSQDTSDTDFDTLGKTGGSKYLQAHSHTFVGRTQLANPGSGGTGTYVGAGSTETSTAGTGNSQNLQPYVVVKRWHRTA